MSESGLTKLTVLGAGVLGGQIAWQSAFRGKTVIVYDLQDDALQACRGAHDVYGGIYQGDLGATAEDLQLTRERLSFSTDLASAVADADIVIEAIPEIPEIKVAAYQDMAGYLPAHTIIATNSSTFLPSQFARASGRPEQYCALHFANLIWSINIAEVMAHPDTSGDTLTAITQFAIEIGMVPVPVQKEYSGYVLNAILVPVMHAAQSLITQGISTPEYVDRTYMIMNRGCSYGPCALMDIVGMKTCFDILNYWGHENGDDTMIDNARYIKENFLDRGLLGLQTSRGYYEYPNPSYQAPGFLEVPDISRAGEIAQLVKF